MIVWLASYPRSGNTLLRILLKRAFNLTTRSLYNDEGDIGNDPAFAALVGHQRIDGEVEEFLETARTSEARALIKTHDRPQGDEPAIYILRDGRAAVVSFYHYLQSHSPLKYDIEDVITGAVPYGAWSAHALAWDPSNRPNTLLLRFEDLRDHPGAAIEKIAAFLKLETTGDASVAFDDLQSRAPKFFRSGSNARNIAELSAPQAALFEVFHGDTARQFGYDVGEHADLETVREEMFVRAEQLFDMKRQVQRGLVCETRLKEQISEKDTAFHAQRERFQALQQLIIKEREKAAEISETLAQTKAALARENQHVQSLTAGKTALAGQLESEKTLNNSLAEKIAAFSRDNAAFAQKIDAQTAALEAAGKRLAVFEDVLAPRLKSILTLRPLRFALNERNRVKRGETPFVVRPLGGVSDRENEKIPQGDGAAPEVKVTIPKGEARWPEFGIAVFAHTRADVLRNTLESLARQDAISVTHVFIDGDQGRPDIRQRIEHVQAVVRDYPVKQAHHQRSAFGFRKMMMVAGRFMQGQYDRFLFLEDDCFPVDGAIAEFNRELSIIENDDGVFSVYGHHFLVESEGDAFGRFQGWGWATTRGKLAPVWKSLEQCYLMSEPDYLAFVQSRLTPAILRAIDVTPGRQPSDTLTKFFAWDETVCLLAALAGQRHKRSDRRLIYNCGAGLESSHFKNLEQFRRPPYNMIGADEVWSYFQPKSG